MLLHYYFLWFCLLDLIDYVSSDFVAGLFCVHIFFDKVKVLCFLAIN